MTFGRLLFAPNADDSAGKEEPNDNQVAAATVAEKGGKSPESPTVVAGTGTDTVTGSSDTDTVIASGDDAAKTAADEWVSIRDAAKAAGIDVSRWQDDESAIQEILRGYAALDQARPYVQYGQRYAQHAPQFEAWLANQGQRPQQAQQPAPKEKPWWKPPEFNPSWASQVEFDPNTGIYKAREGQAVAPETISKVAQYVQWRRDAQERFSSDPESFITEIAASKVKEIVDQSIQQNLGSYKDQVLAESFVDQNEKWIFQHDQAGNPVLDPLSRGKTLTPEGMAFATHLQESEKIGIQGLVNQQNYALRMVMADRAMQGLQQAGGQPQIATPLQQAAQKSQQIKNDLLAAGAARSPNYSGSTVGQNDRNGPTQNPNLDLKQMLLQSLREAGVTDKEFAA